MKIKNKYPVILVHGFTGWGEKDNINKVFPYFGYAVRDSLFSDKNSQNVPGFDIHEASVGPFSSFWDRACELIAQIKGIRVDYTEEHIKEHSHDRYGKDYTGQGFHPNWDENNPVHLVAHSAGGHTCTYAQYILANDLLGIGSNENWIKSISGVSSSWNGGIVAYSLGVNKNDATLDTILGRIISESVKLVGGIFDKVAELIYDFDIEHYNYEKQKNESLLEYVKRITQGDALTTGKDNLGYGLSLQGGYEACELINTYPNTYYFSYVSQETHPSFWNILPWNDNIQVPDANMNPILRSFAAGIGSIPNEKIPDNIIPGWGSGMKQAEYWRENDGIVSTISQKYPWISEKEHPVGGNIVAKDEFSPGKWYYSEIREMVDGGRFDHLETMMFPNIELFSGDSKRVKQFWKDLYIRLASLD